MIKPASPASLSFLLMNFLAALPNKESENPITTQQKNMSLEYHILIIMHKLSHNFIDIYIYSERKKTISIDDKKELCFV
jgi:hypothetical protein